MRKLTFYFILLTFLLPFSNAQLVAGEPLPTPEGKTILSVGGNISVTNRDQAADFDLTMLKALGVTKVTTSTAWTEGVSVFEGVLLNAILERVGAQGGTLTARALNDYAARLPIEDARKWPVILAFSRDGKTLSVRDKGPLWIVYPRDDHPELNSPDYNTKWVWQLKSIEVK